MELKNGMKEVLKGVGAFVSCGIEVMGCYPVLPAFFAICNMEKKSSLCVMAGSLIGILTWMPMATMVKYIFILAIVALATRLYRWANQGCGIWEAGLIAGLATIVMNWADKSFRLWNTEILLTGLSEGISVVGLAVLLHYLSGIPFRYSFQAGMGQAGTVCQVAPVRGRQAEKMESLAYAVNGLSDAFLAMSQPKEKLVTDTVSALEQEITGKLCASCDGCVICWNENRIRRQGSIRALLHAVVNHSSKEELINSSYVEHCRQYEDMVEEAMQAFGRLELNYAWYNRLQENRYVIAQQLDAMAGLMEEWAKARVNVDKHHAKLLARVVYEAKDSICSRGAAIMAFCSAWTERQSS